MKELVVLSGKGGTGKTTLATSLFASLPNAVLADCDVDAPDTHILLNPTDTRREDFHGTRKARIQDNVCSSGTACGGTMPCMEHCRFSAMKRRDAGLGAPIVLDYRCEGCGVCLRVCPVDAVVMEDVSVGVLAEGETDYGPMVHARLRPGEETSGKLVSAVRRRASEIAEEREKDFLIIDGSPGIGCPVISSLTGADLAVLVVEPSLSALRDMERLATLLAQFRIGAVAVINKWDIAPEVSGRIDAFCAASGIEVGMRLPFDAAFADAVSRKEIPALALGDLFRENGFSKFLERLAR